MAASGSIEARVINQQTLYRAVTQDVRVNDFAHVGEVYIAVPDGSGYTTTVGPCSHWSRHPDLLARTVA